MAITGEKIYEFTYIRFNDNYPTLLQSYIATKIIEVESKHVAFLNDKTKVFLNFLKK